MDEKTLTSCIVVEDMALCLKPGRICKWFTTWLLGAGCKYNTDGRCCHVLSIHDAHEKGRVYRLVKKEQTEGGGS